MALAPQGVNAHPLLNGTAQNTASDHPYYHSVDPAGAVNNVVYSPPPTNPMGHYSSHQSAYPIFSYTASQTSNVGT